MDVVLALGFDLFFKPKMAEAAKVAGVELRYANPAQALVAAASAARIVADVSVAGVEEALREIRAAHPTMPILACYPHVEAHRAEAVRALRGIAIPRGAFAGDLVAALSGRAV